MWRDGRRNPCRVAEAHHYVLLTIEILQLQFLDKVIDVPVQVSQAQVVEVSAEIPQLQLVEKTLFSQRA